MHPFAAPLTIAARPPGPPGRPSPDRAPLPGPITHRHHPQMLFASESLTQALRQLELYGRDGLPVISADGQHIQGWITSQNVLQAVARHMHPAPAAPPPVSGPQAAPGQPPTPLPGYQILEITIPAGSPAGGQTLGDTTWPPGWIPVTVLDNHTLRDPDPGITLAPGDRVNLLTREPHNPQPAHPHDQPASQPDGHPPDTRPTAQTPASPSGAPDPLIHRQQRRKLVAGPGRIPGLPGPGGQAGPGVQGARVLGAQDPLIPGRGTIRPDLPANGSYRG
jgi:hypothetical protein